MDENLGKIFLVLESVGCSKASCRGKAGERNANQDWSNWRFHLIAFLTFFYQPHYFSPLPPEVLPVFSVYKRAFCHFDFKKGENHLIVNDIDTFTPTIITFVLGFRIFWIKATPSAQLYHQSTKRTCTYRSMGGATSGTNTGRAGAVGAIPAGYSAERSCDGSDSKKPSRKSRVTRTGQCTSWTFTERPWR